MKLLRLAVCLYVASALVSHARASVQMTIDEGSEVRLIADNGSGPPLVNLGAASFALNGTTRSATDQGATVAVRYNWTNVGGVATLETIVTNQALNNAKITQSSQSVFFTLNEPVNYLIEGRLTGTSTDPDDLSLVSGKLEQLPSFRFIKGETEYTYSTSFDLQLDGILGANNFGPLSGTLAPGSYWFVGLTLLRDDLDENGILNGLNDMSASGFTRLTLTSLSTAAVPEATTFVVWSLLCMSAVGLGAYRKRTGRLLPKSKA